MNSTGIYHFALLCPHVAIRDELIRTQHELRLLKARHDELFAENERLRSDNTELETEKK